MGIPLYRSRPGGFDIRPAQQTVAQPINDFIYLSEGLSNSYLIVTRDGRVVINTGMGFEAPVHKAVYEAVDRGPIRYILLTQGHVDHVGGVDLLRQDGTEIVAQEGNQAQQADDARLLPFRARRSAFAFADAIGKAAKFPQSRAAGAPPPAQSRPRPSITFEDHYEFELGGLGFELLSTPGGETLDSMIVWLPEHHICFTGNLFSALFGHFPNLVTIRGDHYRDPLRFIESLDRVRALRPELLLVGHHEPVRGAEVIDTELGRLRGAVLYVHAETVRRMNEGGDVLTAMREIHLPDELEVGQGYGKISWGVRAIWENYAGWFHHRSTTELYAAPFSSVHSDILELAGGADAIAGRAGKRAAAGDALQAIHLAEMVLGADPVHRAALKASLTAHRQLLQESGNFWEASWLKREVSRLEEALGRDG